MISISDLKVSLGGVVILKDISFDVKDGEFVAIIGPNGSGKSTLLRALGKMLPYEGTIAMDGVDIGEIRRKDYAKRLAMVSQFNDSAFELTVMDMVLMGRTPYKTLMEGDRKEDITIAEDALQKVGLSAFKDRPLSLLSGGERQRAVLARALVQSTDHLLLDEVTNHLDIYYQVGILSLVKSMDLTVVAALHDVNHALRFADSIVALKGGRLLFNKAPSAISEEDLAAVYDMNCAIGEVAGMRTVRF